MPAAMDAADFFWAKVDRNPLPPAPLGETAREALERRVAWLQMLYADNSRNSRKYCVPAALDDLSPEQREELRWQDLNMRPKRSFDDILSLIPLSH